MQGEVDIVNHIPVRATLMIRLNNKKKRKNCQMEEDATPWSCLEIRHEQLTTLPDFHLEDKVNIEAKDNVMTQEHNRQQYHTA